MNSDFVLLTLLEVFAIFSLSLYFIRKVIEFLVGFGSHDYEKDICACKFLLT